MEQHLMSNYLWFKLNSECSYIQEGTSEKRINSENTFVEVVLMYC
jgi:hypothetical protein